MSAAVPDVVAFESRLSFDELYDRLNEIGPWTWRGTDSDTHGDHLWSRPVKGVTLRIFGERPNWVLQIHRRASSPMSRDEIDRVLLERIFPAIGARNLHPTDPVY
jgi:hypothetical protein